MMKKADKILILVVVAICAAALFGRQLTQKAGATVLVQVDGETYGTYSLSKNQTIAINDTNVLVISDGEAYMEEADCPDGLCISQGHISKSGYTIVCLPNRVVVSIEGAEEEDGVDMVVG